MRRGRNGAASRKNSRQGHGRLKGVSLHPFIILMRMKTIVKGIYAKDKYILTRYLTCDHCQIPVINNRRKDNNNRKCHALIYKHIIGQSGIGKLLSICFLSREFIRSFVVQSRASLMPLEKPRLLQIFAPLGRGF